MRSRSSSAPRHRHLAETNNARRLTTRPRVRTNIAENSREQSPLIQASAQEQTPIVQCPALTLSAIRYFLLSCLQFVPRLFQCSRPLPVLPLFHIRDIITPD